jgi:DNA polymerase (family 10)
MSINHTLAKMFSTMAAVLEIRGEPVFKAIAFSKVGRLIDDMSFDLQEEVKKGTLETIEGIGKSSRKIIEEFVKTGISTDYNELITTIPTGLIELLQIPGLGPKTIRLLWKERDIKNIDELAVAIDAGQLAGLKGIGEKKIEQIRQGLAMRETAGKRVGIVDAMEVVLGMLDRVRSFKGVKQAELAGSIRRRKETIGDADIIAAVDDPKTMAQLSSHFVSSPGVKQVLGEGETKASVMMESGLQIDLRVVPTDHFGVALLYFTGSKDHNVKLRGIAQDKRLTLNEWGLYRIDDWEKAKKENKAAPYATPKLKNYASKTEADVYEALDLRFIDPELREDRGEVDLARQNKLPTLITAADIRGELHCHTTASDGMHSIEEMANAAKALGYEYIVITDHSKSQAIAHGLDAARLLKHAEEVRKIASKLKGITLMIGTEVDILSDGKLDYEDDVLKELDFVVASPHHALRQETDKATARILRAIENKYVNVIGHPTGRLINQRVGLEYDWKKVFEAAATSGTAMEINAGWPRLDLNDNLARMAIAAGVTLTIDTDAHHIDSLKEVEYGVWVARRAGAEKKHVLNAQPLTTVREWVSSKR